MLRRDGMDWHYQLLERRGVNASKESRVITLALPGVQNSYKLFEPHIKSMQQRGLATGSLGDVVLLDYMEWFDLDKAASELSGWLQTIGYGRYETIYLDGVSCGNKVFVEAILRIYQNGENPGVLDKIVLNCINGVTRPADVKNPFLFVGSLPLGWLDPILTPVLKLAHAKGWLKEAEEYGKLDDSMVRGLNVDANLKISWSLFLRQLRAMSKRLPDLSEAVRLKGVNAIYSADDEFVNNSSVEESLERLFGRIDRRINVFTKHSTLAYKPEVWQGSFYTVKEV